MWQLTPMITDTSELYLRTGDHKKSTYELDLVLLKGGYSYETYF
jgi:hypothetical protein